MRKGEIIMKKKLAALFFTAALLCVCLCGTALAADGQVTFAAITEPDRDECWRFQTRVYCRNETGKTVQTENWEARLYSTSIDPYTDPPIEIPVYAKKNVETTQKIPPFQPTKNTGFWIHINHSAPKDSPFRYYRTTDYVFINGQTIYYVFQDLHGSFFVQTGDASTGTYLTEDEIQHSLFPVSSSFVIPKTADKDVLSSCKVTFEDGTTMEVPAENLKNPEEPFQNPPFAQQTQN